MGTRPVLGQFSKPLTELAKIEHKRLEEAWCREWVRAQTYRDIAEAAIAFLQEKLQELQERKQIYRTLVENANEVIVVAQDGALKYVNPKALNLSQEELILNPVAANAWSIPCDELSYGIAMVSLDFEILNVNYALCNYLGKAKEELIGKRCYEVLHGKDTPISGCLFAKVKLSGQPDFMEVFEPALNAWIALGTSPLTSEEGRVVAGIHSIRDITERKRMEERLAYLATFPELNPMFVVEIDELGNVSYLNPAARKRFPELAVSGEKHPYLAGLTEIAPSLQPLEGITREVKAGEQYYEQVISRIADNRSVRVYGHDITERKRAEEALLESEEKLQRIFDAVTDGIAVTDLNGVITDQNENALRLGGHASKSELIGKSAFEAIAPHDRDRALASMMALAQEGVVGSEEFTLVRADGSRYLAEITANVLNNAAGNLAGFVSVIRDITKRKRMEAEAEARAKELATSEEKYRRLLDDINDGYFVIQDEKVVFANERAGEIYGVPLDEYIGSPLGSSLPPDVQQQVRERFRRRIAGEAEPERYELTTATGVIVEVNAKLIEYGGRPAVAAVARDISERKRAEEALKNAALETLDALSQVIETTDPYTAGHSAMVTELALKIAKELGLGDDQLNILRIACPLHDVGKVGIPSSILNKPTKLTQAEWLMIHAHPIVSAQTAERVTAFKDAIPAIRHHHERWDGTGYPDRLKGEDIPLLARILAVADGFEAMTSERPYRWAFSAEEALEELRKGAGSQWDPPVVDAFLRAFKPKRQP